jgi:hypothetical protein
MSDYTWIITRERTLGESSDAVGKIGPSGAKDRVRFDIVIQTGEHFRLLDSAGATLFSGYIVGKHKGPEPLDDYGRAHGCCAIEYERNGLWSAVKGAPPGDA